MVSLSLRQLYEPGMKKQTREMKVLDMQKDGSRESQSDNAIFLIQIQYRHNSSWQGRIVWLDKKQTLVFAVFWNW